MPAWLVFICTRHGCTDLKTSESLVVKWRILLHGENLLKCESCANGSCLRLPLKAVAYRSPLPLFLCLIRPFFYHSKYYVELLFSGRDKFSPGFSDRPLSATLMFAAFVKHPLWKRRKKTSSPLSFFPWIWLQNFWRQTMRHKLPCELLTYACLHMISYSQNRLRFEGLTAVEFPLLWIIQISLFITYFYSLTLSSYFYPEWSLWETRDTWEQRSHNCITNPRLCEWKSEEVSATPATPRNR